MLDFDFGPSLEEVAARCKEEIGLELPHEPRPLSWARIETPEAALQRVREQSDGPVTLGE